MRYYFLALGALVVVCVGCAGVDGQSVLSTEEYVAPPAAMLQHPGPMVDGPGPGVLGILASHSEMGPPAELGMPVQIKFLGQPTMQIGWVNGNAMVTGQVFVPGPQDFSQGSVYQLIFSNIPGEGWADRMLFPTLEVRSAHPNTLTYLAHNQVPVEITDEDLAHVASNNMVTKVIYLPDPKHQARAIVGVETLNSTTLDPGVDPIAEAARRGTIMVVLRIGSKDLERSMENVTVAGADGIVRPVSYTVLDGDAGQYAPPMPIASIPGDVGGVPGAMIAAGGGMPGQPIVPIAGMGPTPAWGMPITGTPIGLAGPPHLPLGGPAGLQSHTIRNTSQNRIPEPVDHMLIDVEHSPGYRMPEPVRHIEYKETHPVHGPNELATPRSRASQIYGF